MPDEFQNEPQRQTNTYSWYALGLLMIVYVLNFLDRSIIYILFPLIKKEMSFSDTQLALLGTTSFVIFYTVLGIPFGRIADKGSRTKLIAIGLATWSLFSGLTGFADSFWTLFACRVMVGVGEATLGPAAISLLSDYFPPAKRATVTSIYSMGIAIGAGLAAIFGGYLSQIGWREAFFIVGFPGIALAVLVFFLREPDRNKLSLASETNYPSDVWKMLLFNRSFILLCLGYALLGLATNNISVWGTIYLTRLYNLPIPIIGYWTGVLTLLAGVPATLFGGIIADWFRGKSRGGRMFFGALLSIISLGLWLIILSTDNFTLIIAAAFVLLFAALSWLGAAAADATEIAGANLRGLAIAIYFFTVNIFAYLIGSNLIGLLNDQLGASVNPRMMRYALLVCPVACLLSAICLWLGSRSMDDTKL
jgi:MFS family permease